MQDVHCFEIKEYLDLLDLTVEIESRQMSDYNRKETRTAFSQPGMRYSQAESLIKSLMQDEKFRQQFAVGEFDMVVFDSEEGNCKIYETKHSMEDTLCKSY